MLFSVGHVRDPAVEYIVSGGQMQERSLYFWSAYDNVADLVSSSSLLAPVSCEHSCDRYVWTDEPPQISSFHSSYSTALSTAQSFDAQISADAGSISAEYEGIVAISLRQVFGSVEITISKGEEGQGEGGGGGGWNESDVMVFMKEISSDGVSACLSPPLFFFSSSSSSCRRPETGGRGADAFALISVGVVF